MSAKNSTPQTDTTALPAGSDLNVLISSGQEGGVLDQVRAWWQRVKHGDMGALPAIGGFIVLMILFSVLSQVVLGDQFFLTSRNIANLMNQSATLVMLAAALVFVLLLGEIDLSAAVTYGVAMCAFAVLMAVYSWPWMLALAAAFGIGIATGFIIGFFVAKVGIPSFVVTLGLFLGYQGLELTIIGAGGSYGIRVPEILAIQNSNLPLWAGWVMLGVILLIVLGTDLFDRHLRKRAGVPNRTITLLWIKLGAVAVLGGGLVYFFSLNRGQSVNPVQGIPLVVPIALALLWLGTLLLDRTKFGRYMYAIGGNAEAARRSGVKVTLVKWTAFVVCSTLAVVSGLFSASYVASVDAAFGRADVLSGVAAAVVGGVSLFGGRGRLAHAAIGALVIAVITNGLGLLNLPAGVNFLVTGGVLILAATVDAVSRVRSGGAIRS